MDMLVGKIENSFVERLIRVLENVTEIAAKEDVLHGFRPSPVVHLWQEILQIAHDELGVGIFFVALATDDFIDDFREVVLLKLLVND